MLAEFELISAEFAAIKIKIDNIQNDIAKILRIQQHNKDLKEDSEEILDVGADFPLKTTHQMDEVESKLNNGEERKKLVSNLKVLYCC